MASPIKAPNSTPLAPAKSFGQSACNEAAAKAQAPIIQADRPAWSKGDSAAKPDPYAGGMIGNGKGAAFNPKRS